MNELYETLDLEAFDDFEEDLEYLGEEDFEDDLESEDWEEDLELEDWDFEEIVKRAPIPPKVITPKQAVKAAKVVAQATAGPRAAKKVTKKLLKPSVRAKELELGDYEGEADFEAEFDALGGDWELLGEAAYYAELAAEAETEAEADQFWGMLASAAVPLLTNLAGSLFRRTREEEYDGYVDFEDEEDLFLGSLVKMAVPAISKVVRVAAPLVKRGVKALGRFALSRGKSFARHAATVAPKMVAQSGMSLAQQAAAGRRITPTSVATTLSRQAFRHLSSPRQRRVAARLNRAAAQRYRRYGGRPRYRRPGYPRRSRYGYRTRRPVYRGY